MTCDEVKELLSSYLDDELDSELKNAVEAHLASCPECRAELEQLKETVELCRSLDEVPVPEGFRATLMKRIASERREEVGFMSRVRSLFATGPRRALVVAAAALVLIVGANSLMGNLPLAGDRVAMFKMGNSGPQANVPLGLGASGGASPKTAMSESARSAAPAASAADSAAAPVATFGAAKSTSSIAPVPPVPSPSSSYDMTQIVERQVIKRASLSLEAPKDRFDEVNRQVPGMIEALGGIVQDSNTYTGGDQKRGANYNIRVPLDKFTAAMQQIEGLGKVTGRSMGTQDVTDQYIDLNAQVTNSQLQEKRLQDLYTRAKTVDEMLRIENELNRLRTSIDSLKGRLRYLQNSFSMSTIALSVSEYRVPVKTAEPNIFTDAWNALVRSARGIVIFAGQIVPYLAVGWFIWFLYVTYKKK